jgi:hypothetical protein
MWLERSAGIDADSHTMSIDHAAAACLGMLAPHPGPEVTWRAAMQLTSPRLLLRR